MRKFIYSSILVASSALQVFSQDNKTDTSSWQTHIVYDNILVPKTLKSKKVIRNCTIGADNVKCQAVKVKRKDYACPTASRNNHEGLGVFEWIAHFGGALRKPEPCMQYTERFTIILMDSDTLRTFPELVVDVADYQHLTLGEHFYVHQSAHNSAAVPVNIHMKRDEGTITFFIAGYHPINGYL